MDLGGYREELAWERFGEKPEELRQIAQSIREGAASGDLPDEPEEGEDGVAEGRIAFRKQRKAERDRGIVERKKREVKKEAGRLQCEVCEIDFEESFGDIGTDFIECPYLVPLSEGKERVTSLADLALLCPNCHAMIHKTDPLVAPTALREILNSRKAR